MTQFIGRSVIIRTVTHIYTGRLTAVDGGLLLLQYAAWIGDTGRWAHALSTGTLDEVEPFPDGLVGVGAGAIVDISVWAHPLPRSTL